MGDAREVPRGHLCGRISIEVLRSRFVGRRHQADDRALTSTPSAPPATSSPYFVGTLTSRWLLVPVLRIFSGGTRRGLRFSSWSALSDFLRTSATPTSSSRRNL